MVEAVEECEWCRRASDPAKKHAFHFVLKLDRSDREGAETEEHRVTQQAVVKIGRAHV